MDNKEKAIITDLSAIRKQEEKQPYIGFTKSILKQIEEGKTRDEILHMILTINGGIDSDPRKNRYFTDMVDIVYKWYYKNEDKEFHVPIDQILKDMDEYEKNFYGIKERNNYNR